MTSSNQKIFETFKNFNYLKYLHFALSTTLHLYFNMCVQLYVCFLVIFVVCVGVYVL